MRYARPFGTVRVSNDLHIARGAHHLNRFESNVGRVDRLGAVVHDFGSNLLRERRPIERVHETDVRLEPSRPRSAHESMSRFERARSAADTEPGKAHHIGRAVDAEEVVTAGRGRGRKPRREPGDALFRCFEVAVLEDVVLAATVAMPADQFPDTVMVPAMRSSAVMVTVPAFSRRWFRPRWTC